MISPPRNIAWRIVNCAVLLSLVAAFILTAPAARADGSFLLQLGTYGTRQEANQKWQEVKNANSDVIGALQGHIAEVMLPPDNTPTYRTQVGPLPSRRNAKTLCRALESRNVTCFVVETAFAAADLAPEMAGDVSTAPPPEPAATASSYATARYAPAETPKAASPAEEISSSPVPPIEVASAAIPAAQAEKPFAAVIVPEQKTIVTSRSHRNNSFNPNDMKKSGFFRGTFNLNDQNDPAEETVAKAEVKETVVPASASTADEDDKPGFFGRLFGRSSRKVVEAPQLAATPAVQPISVAAPMPASASVPVDVRGDVQVAEAIRVPVTGDARETASKYIPVADTHNDGSQPEAIAADGNNVYWVQVSYFKNESLAQDFYDELKNTAPQSFNRIRMHLNHPFAKRSRVSLRIGAFTSMADVKNVCAEAKARGLRCTSIRDTSRDSYSAPARKKYLSPLDAVEIPGYRAPVNAAYAPASAAIPASSSPIAASEIGGQWISLGGFATSQSAWNYWKALQSRVPELGNVKTSITGVLGDNTGEKYQLRAGPMETDVDAENMCKNIVKTGNICTVTEGP